MKKRLRIGALLLMTLVSVSVTLGQGKGRDAMNKSWADVSGQQKDSLSDNAWWFKNARYGMFIHWGLFSQAANRWKGKTYYGIGEWIMNLSQASIADYEKLAKEFNPVKFNAREWVQLARDAGMKYIVITAKHHEGFAMFKSANPYNIVDATPFKRDPMLELAEACREGGIRLGFYYSQFQDWHEINEWSTDLKKISFGDYFKNKAQPQINELLTQYGPLTIIWFDIPGEMTKDQSLSLVDLVKKKQPQALINSRIGNGVGDYATYGDHEIPLENVPGLWEAINTSNDSWGYAWYDKDWKGPKEIAADLVSVAARGGNFMLNVGPRGDGTVPETNAAILRTTGQWIKKHEDALYSAAASPWQRALPWGDITVTGSRLNLFVFDWNAAGEILLPGLTTKISSVYGSSGNEKLMFSQDNNNWVHIQLPARQKKELIEVISVELEGKPEVDATPGVDDGVSVTTVPAEASQVHGCETNKADWMEKFGEWKHKPYVGDWKNDTSFISWTINVRSAGKYFVDVEYNAWKEADGGEWNLSVSGGDSLRIYTPQSTGDPGRYRFRKLRAGIFEFTHPGKQILTFAAAAMPKAGGIQLHAIYLSPFE